MRPFDFAQGRPFAAVVLAFVAATAVLLADGEVKVTPVVSEGKVLASFTAPAAWTTDARELVRGGVTLTYAFDVELRRPSVLWADALLAHTRVEAQVKFDSLTGTFQVSRTRDGRLLDSNRSEQEPQVRDWMTAFQRVQLDPTQPLESNAEYYVRVRLFATPRRNVSLWTLWPFSRDDGSGRATFTFIR
jgi:hypothetical protein